MGPSNLRYSSKSALFFTPQVLSENNHKRCRGREAHDEGPGPHCGLAPSSWAVSISQALPKPGASSRVLAQGFLISLGVGDSHCISRMSEKLFKKWKSYLPPPNPFSFWGFWKEWAGGDACILYLEFPETHPFRLSSSQDFFSFFFSPTFLKWEIDWESIHIVVIKWHYLEKYFLIFKNLCTCVNLSADSDQNSMTGVYQPARVSGLLLHFGFFVLFFAS